MRAEPRRVARPRISVVTCVHDGERYLARAIESVLAQTCTDFEYLVVDDASTDGSPAIIERYAGRDARIVPIRNAINRNPSGALNRALEHARGEYFAVLDQDDLAMPDRLGLQADFLDRAPGIGAVGAQVRVIDPEGSTLHHMAFPTDPLFARWEILHRSPILHSAAMLRRDLVVEAGGYPVDGWYANDYILFSRLVRTTGLTNLPGCLTAYRRSPWQTASLVRPQQLGQVILLIHAMLTERLGLRIPLSDLAPFYPAMRGREVADEASLLRAAELLDRIRERYEEVEAPEDRVRELVRGDCASHWLAMAFMHHRTYRGASGRILKRALDLDPALLDRPETRAKLRRWHASRSPRGAP